MFHFNFFFDNSIPQWIQAITGAIGMVALIWTLALQRRATVIQANAVKIEEDRDRRDLLPIFDLIPFVSKSGNEAINNIQLSLERGTAYNVLIEPLNNNVINLLKFSTISLWQPGKTYDIPYTWTGKGTVATDSRMGPLTVDVGRIYFYDEGRRPYKQIIKTNGQRIFMSLAELITEDESQKVFLNSTFHKSKS